MYGKDYNYAGTRLAESIVRLASNGEPVYVHFIENNGNTQVTIMKDGENKFVHCDDLDCSPIRLGYVNHNNGASYIQRMPMRRDWKQGARNNNCVSSNIRLNGIPYEQLRKTVLGEYPTFIQAATTNRRCAFARHWATHRKVLLYKEQEVGSIETINGNKVPILKDEFKHLQEYLTELIK